MRYPAVLLAAHAALVVVACRDALFPREAAAPAARAAVAGDLQAVDGEIDSLMLTIQRDERDVAAMGKVAELYLAHGWFEAAIGPLARALELDPHRRKLWVALDRALERSGRAQVTDAELTQAAREFVEAVRMWGMGC